MKPRSWAVGKNKRFDERIEVRKEPLGVLVAFVEDPPDARLIAAAPELLEALKLCREQLDVCGHGEGCDYCREARELADDAIAKVEGKR